MRKAKIKLREFSVISSREGTKTNIIVGSSKDTMPYLREVFTPKTIEVNEKFVALFLKNNNEIIGHSVLGSGCIKSTSIDLHSLYLIALKTRSSKVILVHNHPSGNLSPSEVDKKITESVAQGLSTLSLELLDHLIITKDDHFSFRNENIL